jgi:deoxyribose-phosphate aldolase
MVINIGDVKDGEYTKIYNEISSIVSLCHSNQALLKVILETGALSKSEIITASILSIAAGADFIKTSTGFNSFGGAKVVFRFFLNFID